MSSIKRLLDGHEPECYLSHDKTEDGCSVCDVAAAAYMRGREDATRAVIAVVINDRNGEASLADCVNAARGGEQE